MIRYDSSPRVSNDDHGTSAATDPDRVLSCSRRRRVLRHLREESATATLDILANAIETEADGTGGRDGDFRAVRIRLHHVDLPMLDDAGLIEYDPERNRAEIAERS